MNDRVKKVALGYAGYFEQREQLSRMQRIADAQRRIAAKKQVLDDVTHELRLLEKDAFCTFKECVNYNQLLLWLPGASKWKSMVRDKIVDGRKKYPEKLAYNQLITKLYEFTGLPDLCIDDIVDFDCGAAYCISFTYADYMWHLYIPNIEDINFDYYERHMDYTFQIRLSRSDKKMLNESRLSFYTEVGSTYLLKDIAGLIQKGLNEMPEEIDNGDDTSF